MFFLFCFFLPLVSGRFFINLQSEVPYPILYNPDGVTIAIAILTSRPSSALATTHVREAKKIMSETRINLQPSARDCLTGTNRLSAISETNRLSAISETNRLSAISETNRLSATLGCCSKHK
jgi:hypothetical protein